MRPYKSVYKKPEKVKKPEQLARVDSQRRHPTMLHRAPRKCRDDSANSLTTFRVAYITLKGGFATRKNNQGPFRGKLGRYNHGTSSKGLNINRKVLIIITTHPNCEMHLLN